MEGNIYIIFLKKYVDNIDRGSISPSPSFHLELDHPQCVPVHNRVAETQVRW